MPQKLLALEPGGPNRVEIKWSGIWKNLTVRVDGDQVGVIPDQRALKAGQTFTLKDGSSLHLVLVTGIGAELRVSRDGVPLPGSSADPEARVKAAAAIIFFIAALSATVGLAVELLEVQFLRDVGFGWESIASGAIFAILGYFVRARRSAIALALAVGLFALDGLITLVGAFGSGHTPPVGGLVARFFLFVPMVRGFGAIRTLKAAERAAGARAVGPRVEGRPDDPWQAPRE
jgi:hypothetical protein